MGNNEDLQLDDSVGPVTPAIFLGSFEIYKIYQIIASNLGYLTHPYSVTSVERRGHRRGANRLMFVPVPVCCSHQTVDESSAKLAQTND
jgi:hypothetical protein